MMNPVRVFLFTFFLVLAAGVSRAKSPVLDFILPAGGEQGTTVTLKLGGVLEPWPIKIWTDSEGLMFEPQKDAGVVKLQITDKAALGPHLMRIYNEEGASKARTILVGHLPEISEAGKNDDFRTPDKIEKTPVVLNGTLDPQGDADSFAITLKASQWLVAKVDCYGIGSSTDPSLHLRDAEGHRIIEAFDTENLDPLLAWQAKKDGTYILQVTAFAHPPRFDIQLDGGPIAVYRLSIYTGAYARCSFPLAAQRGIKSQLTLCGWNLGAEGLSPKIELDASSALRHLARLPLPASPAQNRLNVMLSDEPQSVETEPNDTLETAQELAHTIGISGRIAAAGDQDWFRFKFVKDESVKFSLRSNTLGFALDPVISIWNSDGAQVVESDDAGVILDPVLTWKAPADGSYSLKITDRYEKGGDDFAYYLEVSKPAPEIQGNVSRDAVTLDAGTSFTLKMNTMRVDGFNLPCVATAVDLPPGVIASSAVVPESGGDISLIFTTAADAKPYSGLFRVLILSTDPARPSVTSAAAPLDLELPVGKQIIERTEQLWLTVVPKKPDPPPAEQKKEG